MNKISLTLVSPPPIQVEIAREFAPIEVEIIDSKPIEAIEVGARSGAPGVDGNTPIKGIDYFDGVDGKSAYDFAVEQGFVGTEIDWIESLKGTNGVDGYTPVKGIDYYEESITWGGLVTSWSTPPTVISTTADGSILSYINQATTRYRFVPFLYTAFEDAFYENWDGTILTNLIVRRG